MVCYRLLTTVRLFLNAPANYPFFQFNSNKKIAFLKLDSGIFMDANEKNNGWGIKKEKVLNIADLDKYTCICIHSNSA